MDSPSLSVSSHTYRELRDKDDKSKDGLLVACLGRKGLALLIFASAVGYALAVAFTLVPAIGAVQWSPDSYAVTDVNDGCARVACKRGQCVLGSCVCPLGWGGRLCDKRSPNLQFAGGGDALSGVLQLQQQGAITFSSVCRPETDADAAAIAAAACYQLTGAAALVTDWSGAFETPDSNNWVNVLCSEAAWGLSDCVIEATNPGCQPLSLRCAGSRLGCDPVCVHGSCKADGTACQCDSGWTGAACDIATESSLNQTLLQPLLRGEPGLPRGVPLLSNGAVCVSSSGDAVPEATVACRNAFNLPSNAVFDVSYTAGEASFVRTAYAYTAQCSGSEESLQDCQLSEFVARSTCPRGHVPLGVVCEAQTPCTDTVGVAGKCNCPGGLQLSRASFLGGNGPSLKSASLCRPVDKLPTASQTGCVAEIEMETALPGYKAYVDMPTRSCLHASKLAAMKKQPCWLHRYWSRQAVANGTLPQSVLDEREVYGGELCLSQAMPLLTAEKLQLSSWWAAFSVVTFFGGELLMIATVMAVAGTAGICFWSLCFTSSSVSLKDLRTSRPHFTCCCLLLWLAIGLGVLLPPFLSQPVFTVTTCSVVQSTGDVKGKCDQLTVAFTHQQHDWQVSLGKKDFLPGSLSGLSCKQPNSLVGRKFPCSFYYDARLAAAEGSRICPPYSNTEWAGEVLLGKLTGRPPSSSVDLNTRIGIAVPCLLIAAMLLFYPFFYWRPWEEPRLRKKDPRKMSRAERARKRGSRGYTKSVASSHASIEAGSVQPVDHLLDASLKGLISPLLNDEVSESDVALLRSLDDASVTRLMELAEGTGLKYSHVFRYLREE